MDAKDVGKSKNFRAFAKEETTKKRYAIDETKTLVGTKGKEDYDKAKRALQLWKHFQLGWSEVDATTSVRKGQGVRFDTPVSICLGAKSIGNHARERREGQIFIRAHDFTRAFVSRRREIYGGKRRE